MARSSNRTALIAGAITALGASACCIGPLALMTFGIGGAWGGRLTALEPYRPFFIVLTLLLLGLVFRKLYLLPRVCAPGTPCAEPRTVQRQRIMFWVVAGVITGLLTVPSLASRLYHHDIPKPEGPPVMAVAAPTQTVVLHLEKMTCELCTATVRKSLEAVPGVNSVKVDFEKSLATVSVSPDKFSPEDLTKATGNVGYPAIIEKEFLP